LKIKNQIKKNLGTKTQADSASRLSVTTIEEQGILESFARLPQAEREIVRQLLDEFGSQRVAVKGAAFRAARSALWIRRAKRAAGKPVKDVEASVWAKKLGLFSDKQDLEACAAIYPRMKEWVEERHPDWGGRLPGVLAKLLPARRATN
jgi:hypothetical protein